MKLKSLTIPEDSASLSAWIESQLMSYDLGDTVAEMHILGDTSPEDIDMTLSEVIADNDEALLSRGLSALSEDQLLQLIGHPYLLNDLKEFVLLNGGEYWQNLAADEDEADTAVEAWKTVQRKHYASPEPVEVKPEQSSAPSYRWKTGLSIAIAACLLIGAFVLMQPKPPTGWGFNNPAVLTAKHSEDEMLDVLANAAHAWFNKVPQDADQLALRLKQFNAGCQKLLEADLPQLSEETREEVRRICQQTQDELSNHLKSIEAGEKFVDVKKSADETATRLEDHLRALR